MTDENTKTVVTMVQNSSTAETDPSRLDVPHGYSIQSTEQEPCNHPRMHWRADEEDGPVGVVGVSCAACDYKVEATFTAEEVVMQSDRQR